LGTLTLPRIYKIGPKSSQFHETLAKTESDPQFRVDETLKKKTRLACTRRSKMSLINVRHYEAKSMVFQKVIWRLSKIDSFFDANMEF